jgi:hypothetical protein
MPLLRQHYFDGMSALLFVWRMVKRLQSLALANSCTHVHKDAMQYEGKASFTLLFAYWCVPIGFMFAILLCTFIST